jgi:membrane protein
LSLLAAHRALRGLVVLAYLSRLVRRFRQENFAQLSGSLAFTTLLSLVPFVAVVLTVASMFPIFSTVVGNIDTFLVQNMMPGKTGGVIAKYTVMFSEKAKKLTLAGVLLLLATSLMLMFSIEKAFNHLWRVGKPRALHQRFGLYLVIVLVGPLVAGAVIGSMTYAVTVSLGFFDEPIWVRQMLFKVIALIFMCGFFAFLYYAVPNAKVKPQQALFGGVVATAGVAGIQKLFEFYVINFPAYKLVYGTFATLPIFLLWIYLCWAVVLVGALVVANFQAEGRSPRYAAAR